MHSGVCGVYLQSAVWADLHYSTTRLVHKASTSKLSIIPAWAEDPRGEDGVRVAEVLFAKGYPLPTQLFSPPCHFLGVRHPNSEDHERADVGGAQPGPREGRPCATYQG